MARDWYYAVDGKQFGPVDNVEIVARMRSGELSPQDLVWRDGMADWRAIASVAEFTRRPPPATPKYRPSPEPDDSVNNPFAAPRTDIQPEDFSHLESFYGYAGFWKRFVASFVDSLVFLVFLIPLFFLAFSADEEMFFVLVLVAAIPASWLYFALMESSESQATLGKKAIGIIVTDLEGRRISFGRATGRYFAKTLINAINIVALINAIMVGVTARKQGLHDMMASTLVVNRAP